MTDEKQKQIEEGRKAKEIIEDPLVVGAFNIILNTNYQKWVATKPEDKQLREELWYDTRASLKFKEVFVQILENGKIAEEEVKNNG
tara:strand:- start:5024 stop:5281 length:258 start_codon:yes stop_codon:yes gene_type:complete